MLTQGSRSCRFQRENPEAAGESGRVAEIRETSRKNEQAGGASGVVIEYEAEIEFTEPCYYQDIEHDAGDKLAVYGEAEFVNDGTAWALLPISIWKR